MIYDKIENVRRYLGISSNMDLALTYLLNTDLSKLEDGTHTIDGEQVFINVMHAETNPDRERDYEYHLKYYDIQIDIDGAEDVRFGTEYIEMTKPYQEDIGFGKCKCEAECHLASGRFVICEPGEPHLPGISPEGKVTRIRKAVIKVHR